MSLIISFATLGIIAWYTIETMFLRKNNSQLLRIELGKKEPAIEAFFDNGNSFYTIKLRIGNVGGSAAKNVKITLTPQLDLGEKLINDYFNKNTAFQNGLSILPAGSEYSITAGFTTVASDKYKSGQLPKEYTINIAYLDSSQKTQNFELMYNLDSFFYRVNPNDKTESEKQLEDISNKLEELNKTLRTLVNNK